MEIPSSGTVVVQDEKKRLLGSVDLPTLVTDLGRVGNFVRIAYNGVAGYTELQITIREIGVNVTKLCDKSAVTVSKFKQASGSIIGDLQGTYQFLLDGLEDMALETLHSVTDVAKDMAAAANQLHKDFDEESGRVETALKETMKTKGSEDTRKKRLEETAKELEVDKTKAMEEKKPLKKTLSCTKRSTRPPNKNKKLLSPAHQTHLRQWPMLWFPRSVGGPPREQDQRYS